MSLDPELSEALAADPVYSQPQAPPEGVSLPTYARQQSKVVLSPFSKYYGQRLPNASMYSVTDRSIAVGDGTINLRIITPHGEGEGAVDFPVMVWIHGGGWLLGDLDMDDNHLRTLCMDVQLVIVNVEYRRAPENLFPTAFDDCYASLKWVVQNAPTMRVSLNKALIIGGDSIGGNMAAAIALKTLDDPTFSASPITSQYLREPAVIHPLAIPGRYRHLMTSFEENVDTELLNSERLLNSFKTYGAPLEDLRVSPLLAASHVGLPPAYIQVMEKDPLRDHGLVYEKVLREAGVKTKLVRYKGVVHGFHYSFPWITAAQQVDKDAREGLKWLLNLTKLSDA